MKILLLISMSVYFTGFSLASTNSWKAKDQAKKIVTSMQKNIKNHPLYAKYKKEYKSADAINKLKQSTLKLKHDAVPLLTHVMKTNDFPDNNRWIATFMLGKIMGVKSAEFISKFAFHSNFMLRLASLKSLLALNQVQYKGIYSRLLKDKAMIVRLQALENIRLMKLKELAPYVWAMLYDKKNYVMSEGIHKRGSIIKTIIKTMGDLGFKKAKKPMLAMIQKNKYRDIHKELDYSLSKLSEKSSPEGDLSVKKHFWKKQATAKGYIL